MNPQLTAPMLVLLYEAIDVHKISPIARAILDPASGRISKETSSAGQGTSKRKPGGKISWADLAQYEHLRIHIVSFSDAGVAWTGVLNVPGDGTYVLANFERIHFKRI